VVAFLIAGIVGLFVPKVLGGGHELISSFVTTPFSLPFLLFILLIKFSFTMVSYGSSATGGIFLPLLAIGALIGIIYGKTVHHLAGLSEEHVVTFLTLAMAGYFTAIVKAPITGCILITEITGSFAHFLSMGLVCLTAYLVVDILHGKAIYEALLERILHNRVFQKSGRKDTKVVVEAAVCMGSRLEGKKMKEIEWPLHCLVMGIKRGETEIISHGDTQIGAGDYLIVLTREDNAAAVRAFLSQAGESVYLFPKKEERTSEG